MNINLFKYCLLALFFFSGVVFAKSWYQAEVIIFDYLHPDLDGEQWYGETFKLKDNLVEMITPDDTTVVDNLLPYRVLPSSSNRLTGVYDVLKRSGQYRPLYHLSWQQPSTEDSRVAPFVHIYQLRDAQTIIAKNVEDINQKSQLIHVSEQPDRIIDGVMRIRSGHYLHIDIDLFYFTKRLSDNRTVQNSGDLNPIYFDTSAVNLKETRRVKLNEIHYFDHPMFGIIFQISRLPK